MLRIHDSRSQAFVCQRVVYARLRVYSYTRILLDVRMHAETKVGRIGAREKEREKRNGAGDNNHNNLVKRYKDISH